MPLQRVKFAPTIVANNTAYAADGSWRDGDKVRFRDGKPETIGGWQALNSSTFLGTCRSLVSWQTLAYENLLGVGTNTKYYLERGGMYYDITPIRSTVSLTNPFTTITGTLLNGINATQTTLTLTNASTFPNSGKVKIGTEVIAYANKSGNDLLGLTRGADGTTASSHLASAFVGSNAVLVTDALHGAASGDYVTFSGATSVDGISAGVLNAEHEVMVSTANTYFILVSDYATAIATGGNTVSAAYQITTSLDVVVTGIGWGAGGWGETPWGQAAAVGVSQQLRLWGNQNFGEDLVFNPRGGGLYYWDASGGFNQRGFLLSTLMGASNVPALVNQILITESRFLLTFGCTPLGSTTLDPMLIRWSDQELIQDFTPVPTNLAGDLRLSIGSQIITAVQTRQEILVFTDSALYSLQFNEEVGFTQSLVSDNISIAGPNAVTVTNNTVFWMGLGKFYVYSGRSESLESTVDQYVFENFNINQAFQVCSGVNEEFNEVWWFYPSTQAMTNDLYVVYNYVDNGWTIGSMPRTAWLGSSMRKRPIAAFNNRLYEHELGNDDGSTVPATALNAYIESADFGIGEGENFAFVWRIIPDMSFNRSQAASPTAMLTVKPRVASGAPYRSEGSDPLVTRSATVPVEQYTEQVYVRLRGRQMKLRIESSTLGTAWRLGTPRLDIKVSGRRA